MTLERDLRHAGFVTELGFDPGQLNGWILLGDKGAYLSWKEDGLFRVAQWSSTAGLHVFTEELHMSCLRVVCPWAEAKEIVYRLRRFR